MRLGCEGRPPLSKGQSFAVQLQCPQGKVKLQGQVVWVRRTGMSWRGLKLRYELGVRFVGLSQTMLDALDHLARLGFIPDKGTYDPDVIAQARGFADDDPASATGDRRRSKHTFRDTFGKTWGGPDDDSPDIVASLDLTPYYQRLNVPLNASEQQIHQAYRRLARQWHPDVCRQPDAAETFSQINQAYHILTTALQQQQARRAG